MNDVTLREYVEKRFEAADKAVNAALAAQKEAVTKAENSMEKRFEGVNEFRATLADQQRTLMPRAEAELRLEGMGERIKSLEDSRIEKRGSGDGMKNLWGIILAAIGMLLALIAFLT